MGAATGTGDDITKWDIFYYDYGLLHRPGYRPKLADNWKRELPLFPCAPEFAAFAAAGNELARLHFDFEKLAQWQFKFVWADDADALASASGSQKQRPVPLSWGFASCPFVSSYSLVEIRIARVEA
jgi:hypothetical protein